MNRNQQGFSLIELLIVVVVLGIIAAIAIPNLLASRRLANESSSVSSLRTIHSAEMTYLATKGGGNYAGSLTALETENLVDSVLAGGSKSGYGFSGASRAASQGTPSQFAYRANPLTPSGVTATGGRYFGIATEGVIYARPDGEMSITGGQLDLSGALPLDN